MTFMTRKARGENSLLAKHAHRDAANQRVSVYFLTYSLSYYQN